MSRLLLEVGEAMSVAKDLMFELDEDENWAETLAAFEVEAAANYDNDLRGVGPAGADIEAAIRVLRRAWARVVARVDSHYEDPPGEVIDAPP